MLLNGEPIHYGNPRCGGACAAVGRRTRPVREEAARLNLEENGATPEEIEILLKERVELNAFTSAGLIDWIEGKFAEHGIKKVVPDEDTLASAYRRASEYAAVQNMIDEVVKTLRDTGNPRRYPPTCAR